MRNKRFLLGLLAFLMVFGAAIKPAMAYFTTYTHAKGGYTVFRESTTEIDESFKDWTKTLQIKNTEGSPIFIRARAYVGDMYVEKLKISGTGWSKGSDGWWYYKDPVKAGDRAADLIVKIEGVPEAEADDSFNVAIVYESTYAVYDHSGHAHANWDKILDKGQTTTGGQG